MEVSRQEYWSGKKKKKEYWSGLPFSSPGDLLTQGLNLSLLHCRQIPYHLSYREIPKTLLIMV